MLEVAAPLEPVTREFTIVLAKQAALVAELTRLARRAAKIGAPAITWSFGAVEQREVRVAITDDAEALAILPGAMTHRTRLVPFIKMTLTGSRPKIAGWEFAATVQHVEGVNILRSCPRAEELPVPEVYRTRGPVCDHCKSARNRRDTFLVVSEAGEWKQVGSSCLVDFFGHKDPNALAAYAEMLAAALSLADGAEEDSEGGWGFGGGARAWALVEFLGCVAAEIREGGWVPKSSVPDRPSSSTAAMAEDRMLPTRDALRDNPRDRTVLDADVAIATASYEWALALDATGEHLNDYLWNLYAVAKAGVVERRTFGLAASMVAAYTKAEARKRERAARKPSEHVGTVGETRSFALTLNLHFSFDTGWGPVSRYIFRDADDCVFTWKSSGDASIIGVDYPNHRMVEGSQYILTARIKDHGEYKGTKQTVLTLAAVRPYSAETFQAMRDEEVRKVLGKLVRGGKATAEQAAQFKALDVVARANAKKAREAVAAHLSFETTVMTGDVHRQAVSTEHGLWIECKLSTRYVPTSEEHRAANPGQNFKPVTEPVAIHVHGKEGWTASYDGPDALDKARKYVATQLAKLSGAA